jgi:hypothetical protein
VDGRLNIKIALQDVKSVKAIRFKYNSSKELVSLFEEFRLMCNDAIRIALMEKPVSKFRLIELAYPGLKEYGLHTHYILSACEVAYSAFKNAKRRSVPYFRRHFIKLDSQTYTLNHLVLRIPTRPRHFVYLTLRASNYHLSFVDDPNLKRGSITLTDSMPAIAFTKEIAEIEPSVRIGIDVNERNVTWSDSSRMAQKEDTSAVAEVKEEIQGNQGEDRPAHLQRPKDKTKTSFKVRKAREGTDCSTHTPRHKKDCWTREVDWSTNRNGEAEGHQKAVPQREWTREVVQREDELVGLPRDPTSDRVQSEVGRNSGNVRQSKRHVPKMFAL